MKYEAVIFDLDGIHLFKIMDFTGKKTYLTGFSQTEIQIAAGKVVERQKFPFYPVRHADQVFCPVPQKHPLFCQSDAEAVSCE